MNKYANLVGTNLIRDEFTKINTGFDGVEADINKLETDVTAVNTRVDTIITTPISGEAATQEIVDARVSAVKSKTFATLDARFEEMEQDIATHKADYASAHGGTYHKNLLHNWDFRNPVNQRGLTSYSNRNYTIDRWKWTASDSGLVTTLNSGYITLTNNTGEYGYWRQQLERTLEDGVYAISCITSDGTLYSKAVTVTGGSPSPGVNVGSHGYLYFTSTPNVVMRIAAGGSVSLKAIKLEIGSVSTLANDPPADYGEQLALCQRYQLSLFSDLVPATVVGTNTLYFLIPTPVQMRITPSIAINNFQIRDMNGVEQAGFTITVSSVRSNGIMVRAEKTSHGLTNASINAGTLSLLDANL